MRDKKTKKIKDPFGNDEYVVLFTFQYGKHCYAVVQGEDLLSGIECCRLTWSPLSGTKQSLNLVEDEICLLADKLFERAEQRGDGLKGEHYLLSYNEEGRLKVSRADQAPMLCRSAEIIPRFVNSAILLLLSAALIFWCFKTNVGFQIGKVLLPDFGHDMQVGIIWIAGLMVPQMLYWIFRRHADFFCLIALATLAPSSFYLIASMKNSAVIFWCVTSIAAFGIFGVVIPRAVKMFKEENHLLRKYFLKTTCTAVYGLFATCLLCNVVLTTVLDIPWNIVHPENPPTEQEQQVAERYEEAIGSIERQVWQTLLPTERLNVLQSICDYECTQILGCPIAYLRAADCEEHTRGYFSADSNFITIDTDHLMSDDPSEVVQTALHEARHAWQFAMVNMYRQAEKSLDEEYLKLSVFRMAKEMEYGFDTYYSGTEDFEKYYDQFVEKDSRAFAERRMEEQYEALTGKADGEAQ